jgi:hypothetical protein
MAGKNRRFHSQGCLHDTGLRCVILLGGTWLGAGFAQDAEVAVSTRGFRGVVEGVERHLLGILVRRQDNEMSKANRLDRAKMTLVHGE